MSGMPWMADLMRGTAAAAMVPPEIEVSALGSVPSGMLPMAETRALTWSTRPGPSSGTARTTFSTGASTAVGAHRQRRAGLALDGGGAVADHDGLRRAGGAARHQAGDGDTEDERGR